MSEFPELLLNGHRDFMQGCFSKERANYRELAEEGQSPEVMVIACCDSRVAPETIFGCGPGEMFVMRNVANLVPPYAPDDAFHATSAALEYAVQSLRVKHIVVMGHGRCGGIKAVLDTDAEPLSPGDFIGKWMSMLVPLAEQIRKQSALSDVERHLTLERSSIQNSIDNLKTFPCVNILHGRGKLQLHGAWFDISTGKLWVLDQQTGEFSRQFVE